LKLVTFIFYNKSGSMEKVKIERLKNWSQGKKASPVRATIIITNRCDLNCLFCRGRFSPKGKAFYKDGLISNEWVRVANVKVAGM